MKLLISDSQYSNRLASLYANAIEQSGHVTTMRFAHDDLSQSNNRGVGSRILHRVAPRLATRHVNRRLIELVDQFDPDVVWIFKGFHFLPATLHSIRAKDRLLVNYNADHPTEFFQRGSGKRNIADCLPLYQLFFTYSNRIAESIRSAHNGLSTHVLPFGHNVTDSEYQKIVGVEERLAVAFVGNPDPYRIEFLTKLSQAKFPVDVYGHHWENAITPSQFLKIHPAIVDTEYHRTLRRYRVQLNLFRPHNHDSHNMRSFETPACGGVMLAPESLEHQQFFESGREAFFFRSIDDAIQQCRHLLDQPKNEIDSIREAARSRSIHSGYFYHERASQALQIIEQHFRSIHS